MIEYYQGNVEERHRQLVWMAVMLRRSEIIAPEDKLRIQRELNMSDDPFVRIFEEDPVVQQIMARVEARARAEAEAELERARAEAEAEVVRMRVEVEAARARADAERVKAESARSEAKVEAEALQGVVVTLVNMRFPELSPFARESVSRVKNTLQLTTLVKQVATARDKATVEWALETFAA